MRVVEGAQGVALTDREVFGPAHLGGYPDGIAFDAFGNLWCTLVMVDQLIALTPEGERLLLLDDGNPQASQALLAHMAAGTVTAEAMLAARGTLAPWMDVTDMVALDEALDQLQKLDQRLYQVVELHIFSGLSLPEVASELGVTLRTINRDLLKARALLSRSLGTETPPPA